MQINKRTLNLIKEFEGLYLHAYRDCVGVVTIGYGITNSDRAIIGRRIYMGMKISRATAEDWLIKSLEKKYAPKVLKYQKKYNFNENQFGALLSFAFNVGSIDGLTANGTRSIPTIRKKILEYCKAGGRTIKGLQRRRKAELALFNTPVIPEEPPKPSVPRSYTGTLPAFEKRDYYKLGDGYKTLKEYTTQIIRIQKCLNWSLKGTKGFVRIDEDGKYGKVTEDAVKLYQKTYKIKDINGRWGKLCNEQMKKIRR